MDEAGQLQPWMGLTETSLSGSAITKLMLA